MQAVLYVGHGSRVKEGVDEAIHFINKTQAFIDVPIQEICFLELVKPSVLEGISECVAQGATKIAIVPILLLTAVHANEDIPLEIEKGKLKYPDVEFIYGETLGIHPKIIDSLYDRVVEQGSLISDDAAVLLIGRGSSDPAVKRDLTQIAKHLEEEYPFKTVDVCFLYGAKPSFTEAMQGLKNTPHKQVFIIPYLLFTGVLMTGIAQEISEISIENEEIILCDSLGYHPNIQDVLVERVNEMLEKEATPAGDFNRWNYTP